MNGSLALTCHSLIGRLMSQIILVVLKTALNLWSMLTMTAQFLESGMIWTVTYITAATFVDGTLEPLNCVTIAIVTP